MTIRDFYDRLRASAAAGELGSADALFAESRRLGIEAFDLAMGMLQPLLREVGELWSRGEVSVAMEHLASCSVEDLLGHVRAAHPELDALYVDDAPDVLLVPSPGNAHVIGVNLMALLVLRSGVSCAAVTRPADIDALEAEVLRLRPRILGISLALPEHLEMANAFTERVLALNLDPLPEIIYGGQAFRSGLLMETGTAHRCVQDVDGVLALVQGRTRAGRSPRPA